MKQPPTTAAPLVDQSFIDARSKVIDVAAFLDRVQRFGLDGDYRVQELKAAIRELLTDDAGRAEKVLLALSDPTTEPIPAADIQGAFGAPRRT